MSRSSSRADYRRVMLAIERRHGAQNLQRAKPTQRPQTPLRWCQGTPGKEAKFGCAKMNLTNQRQQAPY